jgi:FlaA1/EpsC-like NDP-sugar epimerase
MFKSWSRTVLLVDLEAVLVMLCGLAALYIRFGTEARSVFLDQRGWLKIVVLMMVVQGAFYLFDLYDFQIVRVRIRLYLGIIQAVGLASICMAILFYAVPQMTLGRGVFTDRASRAAKAPSWRQRIDPRLGEARRLREKRGA